MAKIEQGILGPFRGKVGTVVGYFWRGKHVVRSYRSEINYPNTERQQAERDWFVSMVRFAATARQALLLGLREKAGRWQMTEGNAFVKTNKGCFGHDTVDYRHITIAEGAAAPVRFAAASVSDNGVLRVDYKGNSGASRAKATDRVYVYVYNSATREGLLPAAAERRQGSLQLQLPDGWNAQNIKLWGFVVDSEGRASTSQFVPLAEDENSSRTTFPEASESTEGAPSHSDKLKKYIYKTLINNYLPPPPRKKNEIFILPD